jgi:hypothetical protein
MGGGFNIKVELATLATVGTGQLISGFSRAIHLERILPVLVNEAQQADRPAAIFPSHSLSHSFAASASPDYLIVVVGLVGHKKALAVYVPGLLHAIIDCFEKSGSIVHILAAPIIHTPSPNVSTP